MPDMFDMFDVESKPLEMPELSIWYFCNHGVDTRKATCVVCEQLPKADLPRMPRSAKKRPGCTRSHDMGNDTLRLKQAIARDLEVRPAGTRVRVETKPNPEIWEKGDRVWMNTNPKDDGVLDHLGMANRIYGFNPFGHPYIERDTP